MINRITASGNVGQVGLYTLNDRVFVRFTVAVNTRNEDEPVWLSCFRYVRSSESGQRLLSALKVGSFVVVDGTITGLSNGNINILVDGLVLPTSAPIAESTQDNAPSGNAPSSENRRKATKIA